MKLLLRILLNTVAIAVAAYVVPGMSVSGAGAALIGGLILGFVNGIVKPVLFVLTLPFTLVTFGLFLFVLNAVCLALTAMVVPGFDIDGALGALVGAIVVSLVSWVLNGLVFRDSAREKP